MQALEKAQLTLAQSMFHFSTPEKAPQWVKPIEAEEQEKRCKEEMQNSQSLYEGSINKSIAEKQANFEAVYNKLAERQLTFKQLHSNLITSHPSFEDEKRKLEEKAQDIEKKSQKIQKMIETIDNLF